MARKYTSPQKKAKQLSLDTGCTALYIRVSTERQVDEGFSLDAQREKLLAYCHAHSWQICENHEYVDAGISGKSAENRPALQAMLKAATAGAIQRIVVTEFDRLARNTRDLLEIVEALDKAGCALVLLDLNIDTGTPAGKMIATIMGSLAEWERKLIGERVMTGKRQKAGTGGYNGARVPLGYIYDGETFSINEAQAVTVRRIFDLFNAGESLNAIARQFNENGTPTATGSGEWQAIGISHILRNGFYAGLAQWSGIEAEGTQPAIISRVVYDQAQTLIKSRKPGQRVDLTGD